MSSKIKALRDASDRIAKSDPGEAGVLAAKADALEMATVGDLHIGDTFERKGNLGTIYGGQIIEIEEAEISRRCTILFEGEIYFAALKRGWEVLIISKGGL